MKSPASKSDSRQAPGSPSCRPHRAGLWCSTGTSIVQGGCASRPGMVHTAILGRRLDREAINLGFSGNGMMEPEVARLMAELDPALYVIDCIPNVGERIGELTVPFVRILREETSQYAYPADGERPTGGQPGQCGAEESFP